MFNAGRTAKKGHSSEQHPFYFIHIHLLIYTQKHTKQIDPSKSTHLKN